MFHGASPKLTFVFGLVSGVAGTALIALALFLSTGISTKTGSAKADTTAAANTNSAPTYSDVKKVTDADYIQGDKNAKLTLVTYTDLECPFCKQFHPVVGKVLDAYKGKVRWVYRNFPLSFHQNAEKEAEASLCVGKLGGNDKYWDFVNKIFERTTSNGTGFSLDNLPALAKEVGVNQDKFSSCLNGGEMADTVTAEQSDGSSGGVTGTPTTFVVDSNGKTLTAIPGAYSYEQVKSTIDQALGS
jgi:protein-disulfide isomerase